MRLAEQIILLPGTRQRLAQCGHVQSIACSSTPAQKATSAGTSGAQSSSVQLHHAIMSLTPTHALQALHQRRCCCQCGLAADDRRERAARPVVGHHAARQS